MSYIFDGFMRVPAKTYQSELPAEYVGDWASSDTRYRIFSKPRKYKVTLHVKNAEGAKAVETIDVKSKISHEELSDLIYEQINRLLDEYSEEDIKLIDSGVVIRV